MQKFVLIISQNLPKFFKYYHYLFSIVNILEKYFSKQSVNLSKV